MKTTYQVYEKEPWRDAEPLKGVSYGDLNRAIQISNRLKSVHPKNLYLVKDQNKGLFVYTT